MATADSFLEATAVEAASRGWHVELAANLDGSETRERPYSRTHHVDWSRGFDRPLSSVPALNAISRVLGEGGFDIVHTHTPTASALLRGALGVRRSRPAVIYTAHGFHFGSGMQSLVHQMAEQVERVLLHATDVLVVINDEDEEWAIRNAPQGTRVVRSRGVGVDDRFFRVDLSARQEDWGGPVQSVRSTTSISAIVVGELIPRKRPLMALDAVAMIRGRERSISFVGDGPLHSELRAAAERACSDDPSLRVHFLGVRDDVPDLLNQADVLVHCAAQEGLPTAVLEAMARGVPVAAFDIRGCRELLASGSGILVRNGDVAAMARAVEMLSTDAGVSFNARMVAQREAKPYRRRLLAQETCDLYRQTAALPLRKKRLAPFR